MAGNTNVPTIILPHTTEDEHIVTRSRVAQYGVIGVGVAAVIATFVKVETTHSRIRKEQDDLVQGIRQAVQNPPFNVDVSTYDWRRTQDDVPGTTACLTKEYLTDPANYCSLSEPLSCKHCSSVNICTRRTGIFEFEDQTLDGQTELITIDFDAIPADKGLCLPPKVGQVTCNPYSSRPILTSISRSTSNPNTRMWICKPKYPGLVGYSGKDLFQDVTDTSHACRGLGIGRLMHPRKPGVTWEDDPTYSPTLATCECTAPGFQPGNKQVEGNFLDCVPERCIDGALDPITQMCKCNDGFMSWRKHRTLFHGAAQQIFDALYATSDGCVPDVCGPIGRYDEINKRCVTDNPLYEVKDVPTSLKQVYPYGVIQHKIFNLFGNKIVQPNSLTKRSAPFVPTIHGYMEAVHESNAKRSRK